MSSINTDLTQVLSPKYANKWVALNSRQTRVVAFGKNPGLVLKKAREKKVRQPVVTFVVKNYGFFVP